MGFPSLNRHTRLLTLCVLVLIQVWAPLVHAHPADGEPWGKFHVPGLEFLERTPGEGWHVPDAGAETSVVVAMQGGILEPSRVSSPRWTHEQTPDHPPCHHDTPPVTLERAAEFPRDPFIPLPYGFPVVQPHSARAPPADA